MVILTSSKEKLRFIFRQLFAKFSTEDYKEVSREIIAKLRANGFEKTADLLAAKDFNFGGFIEKVFTRYHITGPLRDDLRQDALMKLLGDSFYANFDESRNFVTYMSAVVENVVRRYFEDHSYKKRKHKDVPLDEAFGISTKETELDAVIYNELLAKLYTYIEKYGNHELAEIFDYLNEGYNHTEIGEMLGKTKDQLYLRIKRLRQIATKFKREINSEGMRQFSDAMEAIIR